MIKERKVESWENSLGNKTEKKQNAAETIREMQHFRYNLVLEGIAVGILAGMAAILYRLALEHSSGVLMRVLDYCKGKPFLTAGWFFLLVLMAVIVGFLVKWEPMISGSGIPQIKGEMAGHLDQSWWRVIAAKFAGGVLCILGGLSLGREGPSIQLGAMAGKGLSKSLGRGKTEEKFLITCGAGAGLSAAFHAPLAGVMFALEEIHKNFSSLVLVSVTCASVTADFIAKNIFGLTPVFQFEIQEFLPLTSYGWLILLGFLLGIAGAIYNKVLLLTQDLYKKIKIKAELKPIIPFITAGILGFLLPQVLGGGQTMVNYLMEGNLVFKTILLLFAVKFLFSMVSFSSGAPGGIFFPLLVLGAFFGGAFGLILSRYFGVDGEYINNFIILAMAGYFTAIVRAPITGIVLISEMTGSFQYILPLSLVAIVSYITATALRSAPIYDSLLERILIRMGKQEEEEDSSEKILLEMVIEYGSKLDNKLIREVSWPKNCLLIAIRREGKELIPKGETKLYPGDTIVALSNESKAAEVYKELEEDCAFSERLEKGE